MSKRMLLTLVVILVVVVAIAIIRHYRSRPMSLEEQLGYVSLAPEDFLVSKISRVELYSGAKPDDKVVLSKSDGKWFAPRQFNAPVDSKKLEAFLDKLKKLEGEHRTSAPGVLGDFELNEEQAIHMLVYAADEHPAAHLLVGKSPQWQSVFVRHDGQNAVYLVPVNLRNEVGIYSSGPDQIPETKTWLDLNVLEVDKGKVRTLRLRYPDKSVAFELSAKSDPDAEKAEVDTEDPEHLQGEHEPKKPVLEWVLTSGGPLSEANDVFKQSGLDKVLSSLERLVAADIVDPGRKSDWGLDSPAWQIDVTLEDGTTHSLSAGRPNLEGDAYVMLGESNTIYQLSRWEFERLFVKGADLFDLKGFGVAEHNLVEVRTTSKAQPIVFRRSDDDKWVLVEPAPGFDTRASAGKDLAKAIADWKPQDYADGDDLAAFGIDTEMPTITFKTKDGASHTLSLGGRARSIQGRYAVKDATTPVLVADQSALDKFLPQLSSLFESDVLAIKRESIISVEVRRDEEFWRLVKSPDGWQVRVGDESLPSNQEVVDALLDALDPLEAQDFEPQVGIIAAFATLTIERQNAEPVVLSLSQGRRCTLPGRTLDVILHPGAFEALTPSLDAVKRAPAGEGPAVDEAVAAPADKVDEVDQTRAAPSVP